MLTHLAGGPKRIGWASARTSPTLYTARNNGKRNNGDRYNNDK